MQLTTLHLTSFRSFAGIDLPLDTSLVYVAGVNGSGKSSTRELIKYVLTGKCQGLDARGAGSEVLVPTMNGSKGVSGGVTLHGLGRIERTWDSGGSSLRVEGFTGNSGSQQQALYDRLQTTEPFLAACLDSAVFLRLHHADAKALVLALLDVQIEVDGTNLSLEQLDGRYQKAFEDRKIAKTKLKGSVVPAKPEGEYAAVADIDTKLTTLRGELEALVAETSAATSQHHTLRGQIDRIQRSVTIRQHAHAEADIVTTIADLEERLGIMEGSVEEPAPEIAVPQKGSPERVAFLTSRIEALKAHAPADGCVLDAQVPCKTASLSFRNKAKDYQAELDTLPKATPATAQKPVSELSTVRTALESAKGELASYEAERAEKARVRQEVETLNAELEGLPDMSYKEGEVTTLRGRIRKGEEIRGTAAAHWQALKTYETALQAQTTLKAEVDRLETLCQTLGPTGIRVPALQAKMGPFEAAINQFTTAFGWTVTFMLEPWDVLINNRPVETYSESEQYRIGIAIQIAVALLSGLKFAVVDQIDILTKENRNRVIQMLLQAPLDQILLLSAKDDDQNADGSYKSPLPKVPGLLAYRLGMTDGRTVILEQVRG